MRRLSVHRCPRCGRWHDRRAEMCRRCAGEVAAELRRGADHYWDAAIDEKWGPSILESMPAHRLALGIVMRAGT